MNFISNLLARVDEQISDDELADAIAIPDPPKRDFLDANISKEQEILRWADDQRTRLESEISDLTERLRQTNIVIEARETALRMLEAGRQ